MIKSIAAVYFLVLALSASAQDYSHVDPQGLVPKSLLTKALDFFEKNQARIKNKEVIGIIDFSQHSSKERFYLIDLKTGDVDKYLVAHGKNSDPNHDGFADVFSNKQDSLMSSQGFYLTGEDYNGKKGHSMRLDGLSDTNSKAREREIVIHGAAYVAPGIGAIGRSWGCPAVEFRYVDEIIKRMKDGALLLAE